MTLGGRTTTVWHSDAENDLYAVLDADMDGTIKALVEAVVEI